MKSIRSLGSAVVTLLLAQAAVNVLGVGLTFQQVGLVQKIRDGRFVTMEEVEASDRAVGQAAGLWLLVFLATVVVWLIWQHRATTNLRALGAAGRDFTPRAAVWWWFVPIASFFKPFQAMRELWSASARPQAWKPAKAPALMSWWWAVWVGGNLVSAVGAAMKEDAEMPKAFLDASYVQIAADLALIVAAFLAVKVVRGIVALQENRPAPVAPAIPPAPPPWGASGLPGAPDLPATPAPPDGFGFDP